MCTYTHKYLWMQTQTWMYSWHSMCVLHLTHTYPPFNLETCDIWCLWSILETFSDCFGILFSFFWFLKQSWNFNRCGEEKKPLKWKRQVHWGPWPPSYPRIWSKWQLEPGRSPRNLGRQAHYTCLGSRRHGPSELVKAMVLLHIVKRIILLKTFAFATFLLHIVKYNGLTNYSMGEFFWGILCNK